MFPSARDHGESSSRGARALFVVLGDGIADLSALFPANWDQREIGTLVSPFWCPSLTGGLCHLARF